MPRSNAAPSKLGEPAECGPLDRAPMLPSVRSDFSGPLSFPACASTRRVFFGNCDGFVVAGPEPVGCCGGGCCFRPAFGLFGSEYTLQAEQFPPPPAFAARAHLKSVAEYEQLCKRAADDPEGFWAQQAQTLHVGLKIR